MAQSPKNGAFRAGPRIRGSELTLGMQRIVLARSAIRIRESAACARNEAADYCAAPDATSTFAINLESANAASRWTTIFLYAGLLTISMNFSIDG